MSTPPTDRVVRVRGARQNNLRDIDVDFPRGRLSVITGVSGSGKSSLALDTVYAEGHRRYVASLSTYAQQFLDRLPRPDLDSIDGLPPAIAIERSNPTLNRRSTVGTATEVFDYLRLLFARAGTFHCPTCEVPVHGLTPPAVADSVAEVDAAWYVTFELPVSESITHATIVDNLLELGFVRVLAGGEERHLEELPEEADLALMRPLFVVVDRLRGGRDRSRWVEAVERAYEEGDGEVVLFERGSTAPEDGTRHSRHVRCDSCGTTFPDLRPALFSFNSPYGACSRCNGFGFLLEYDEHRIVPDRTRSLAEGAIDPWSKPRYAGRRKTLRRRVAEAGLEWDVSWEALPEEGRRVLLRGGSYGGVRFEGVLPFLNRLERKKYKPYVRFFLRTYQSHRRCPSCEGSRLREAARTVRVAGRGIAELAEASLPEIAAWVDSLDEIVPKQPIVAPIVRELSRRLDLLLTVGLEYLTLDRLTRTLSGGEAQRIAIANALGSRLTDGLYVLDEPSIGLHARDTQRLIGVLRELSEGGNTVLVVEHDLDVVRQADQIVELGPGSGADGGRVVFAGPPSALIEAETTTGAWLSGDATLPARGEARPAGPDLVVRGARAHNLVGIDVRIPLGCFVAVTGVSGSGKSTLVHDILHRALSGGGGEQPGAGESEWEAVLGAEWVNEVVLVDQSPIGKSPRSNPVTYIKAFDRVRALFASTPGAKRRGFGVGSFSFNTAAGRCPACRGDGHERIEMVFLPDVFVTCEVCRGKRFRGEVLDVRYRGLTIADVLELTVDEALVFFSGHPSIGRGLWVLQSVGLGYLRLGQPATTLSGGESQRLKIARELNRKPSRSRSKSGLRGNLYLMDEPTTGLHNADISALIRVVDALVGRGDTVVVVEHHLDVIARADWIIDLGPEGGPDGGRIVAEGSPEDVAACRDSHTGTALRTRVRELAVA